jgi:hypothetical protein
MSQAASQAAAFYREVAASGKVWTVRDAGGFPAPRNGSGDRSMPFWSSLERVERIIKEVPAYAGFQPLEMTLPDFRDTWLSRLEKDQLHVGLNWTGPRATGYDIEPGTVRQVLAK